MTTQAAPTHTDAMDALSRRVLELERKVDAGADTNALTLVVFSGELDKLLAAFVIATGAAACDMTVSMFFTFWGTAALKKQGPQVIGKSVTERVFGWMLPGGFHNRKLSHLDFAGLGRRMMAREMSRKGTPDLPSLIELAGECEIEIDVCEMSMSLMGIRREELIDYPRLKFCGVARCLEQSSKAGTTLFI